MEFEFLELRAKFLRYSGVSIIAVAVTQSVLWLGIEVVEWSPLIANLLSVSLGAIPAYLLNKKWVWGRQTEHSIQSEILPFWIYNFLGLALSSGCVAFVSTQTSSTVVVMLTNLLVFASLWIGKFFLLERVIFRQE